MKKRLTWLMSALMLIGMLAACTPQTSPDREEVPTVDRIIGTLVPNATVMQIGSNAYQVNLPLQDPQALANTFPAEGYPLVQAAAVPDTLLGGDTLLTLGEDGVTVTCNQELRTFLQ